MRIAVCFSGLVERLTHGRSGGRHTPGIGEPHNLFAEQMAKYKGYDHCDIFFSFWQSPITVQDVDNYLEQTLPNCMSGPYDVPAVVISGKPEIKSKYSQANVAKVDVNFNALQSQYAAMYRADLLRQKYEHDGGFKYDMVFKARPDAEVVGDYNLPAWNEILKSNSNVILLPANQHHPEEWQIGRGMYCDHWFGATSDMMTRFTTLTHRIDEYVSAGCWLHPEALIWWHITNGLNAYGAPQYFRHLIHGRDFD